MTNKKLYCEDVLQILFDDSDSQIDSEREYLPFGNNDRPSNDRASPGMARVFTKHKQVIILGIPLPNGDGVAGVDMVLVSIGEALHC